MQIKYTLPLLVLLMMIIPVAVALFSNNQEAVSLPEPNTISPPSGFAPLAAIPAENATSNTGISALGTIEANEVAEVSFLVSGEIAEIAIEVGDNVSEGDLLAWLDATETQVAYDQARLSLERAQINLNELYEPPDESTLRVADANIASAQAAYSAIANPTSASDLESAELRYQQALNTYESEVSARTKMDGTEAEIAIQEATIGAASFDLEIARLQLEALQNPDTSNLWSAGVRIRQAQLQKEELLAGPTQSEIDSAQLAVQQAEQALTETETALQRTRLYAPISGTVTAVSVEPGDTVSPSTIVVEISDLSQLWLTASVHEVDVDQLHTGLPASVTLDSLPEVEILATVEQISWLSTVEDDIVYYDTRFALNTNDPRIRVGMTSQAVVEIED